MKNFVKNTKIYRMDDIRNIYISIIAIVIIMLLAIGEPLFFSLGSFVMIVLFLLIRRGFIPFLDSLNYDEARTRRRQEALREARMYLAPYDDIWRNLRLSNKYCYLLLEQDGTTIVAKEKGAPYRKFRIVSSSVHDYIDLWDMFCKKFSHNTSYSGLLEMSKRFKATAYEYSIKQVSNTTTFANNINSVNRENVIALGTTKAKTEKLDVNNCSEIELTALPGISIVMAKKAIKKREEIGGFKTIDDFFLFMRLRPHMEQQLRELVSVKKMKGARKKMERNSERSVDL